MLYGLFEGSRFLREGGHCMDKSATFTQWYLEWVRQSYPMGRGMTHPLDEPILNAWAQAADAAGIARPDASYVPEL